MTQLLLLTTLIISLSTPAIGQQAITKFDALYIIEEGRLNDSTITEHLLYEKAFIGFTTIDSLIFMSNNWTTSNSQSYGPLFDFKIEKIDDGNDAIEIIVSKWHYVNTYDSIEGIGLIVFKKIFKSASIKFELDVVTEKNDRLFYSGYMKND